MSRIGLFFNRINFLTNHLADPQKNHINNKNLTTYASSAQQHALKTNDAESLQIADDEALARAIQASLNEQVGNPSQQNNTTTTDQSLQIVEDEALARAIQASLNEQTSNPALQNKAPTTAQSLQIAEDEALARAIQANKKIGKAADPNAFYLETRDLEYINSNKLRNWLNQEGYRIVHNNGKNNNCLLISLLQHVTGDYESQHSEKAAYYKAILEKQSNGDIGKLDPLHFDTPLIASLINRIGKDHGREISVNFYVAYDGGKLSERIIGSGSEQFTIFDQGGHFEAVLPPTKIA